MLSIYNACRKTQARLNMPNKVFLFSFDIFQEKNLRIENQPSIISKIMLHSVYVPTAPGFYVQIISHFMFTPRRALLVQWAV